jgi:hypothetical protein
VAHRLTTRAAPRAALIAALSGQDGIVCGWTGVERTNPRDRIDLSHPLRIETPGWLDGGGPASISGSAGERPSNPACDREPMSTTRRATLHRWFEFWGDNL